MKVLSLHIENIRGIKKIDLEPRGENFVVFGPNGTGKSAVVDALDFLFTGKISRLVGEGTKGVTLSKHGCHIDKSPKETVVKAEIEMPGSEESIILERTLSNPLDLKVLKGEKSGFSDVLKIASRGHHVLSRREILKYVAAQKGERAKEIQALLNLEKVEKLRQDFVRVEHETEKEYENLKMQYESRKNELCRYLSISQDQFSEKKALEKINEMRENLKGKPIKELEEENIKRDLSPPSIPTEERKINPELIKTNLDKVKTILSQESLLIRESEKKLICELNRFKTDEKLRKELQSFKLLKLGISLLDDSGKCPLCEKAWKPKELRRKLKTRLLSAEEAKKLQSSVDELLENLRIKYNDFKICLGEVVKSFDILSLKEMEPIFQHWVKEIKKQIDALSEHEKKLNIIEGNLKKPNLFAPEKIEEKLEIIEKKLESEGKKLSEEQKIWDALTKIEHVVQIYKEARERFKKSELIYKQANLLRIVYEESKDKILNDLYERIKNDFVTYYKFLHGEDEKEFDADFKAKGAELSLDVDFYGRGKFPPVALHSEGHQDSMGICLYLALMKLLSEEKVQLTVLDDVVMSIDDNHRRAFSKLLLKFFPNKQFLITTHNRTWARQLQTEGIVKGKNTIEFKGWSVDHGPVYEKDSDMWVRIDKDIEENNITSAAATLREGAEYYFQDVCDKIKAKVVFKADGRYELGDLLPEAVSQYKKILRKAKESSNSWGNKKQVEKLSEIESIANEIIKRTQYEQWGINENIHYSRWKDFSSKDFQPIAEAFRDLFDLFRCSDCGSLLYVTEKKKELNNFRCNCQKISWNLIIKKR